MRHLLVLLGIALYRPPVLASLYEATFHGCESRESTSNRHQILYCLVLPHVYYMRLDVLDIVRLFYEIF